MILDKLLEFCDNTAVNTGGAATYLIGSQVDTKMIGANLGAGTSVYLVIRATATLASATGTVQFKLVSDDTASISTSTSTVHYTSAVFAGGALTAGSTVCVVELPHGTYEEFLGILQVTGTAAITSGNIDAFLTTDPAAWQAYTSGLS